MPRDEGIEVTDDVLAEVMAQRAYAVSRLTPSMMTANVVNSCSVLFVLYLEGASRLDAYIWAALVVAVACYFLLVQRSRRHRPFPSKLSVRTYRRSIFQASLVGVLWAYPGFVILPGVSGLAQAFLVAMAAGMVAGGAITLYPMPLAAYAFSGLILVGSMAGFGRTGEPVFWGFLAVSVMFSIVIFRSVVRHERIFVSEFMARRSLNRQNDRMGELLEAARAEVIAERKHFEDRLVETQRMEAIGQLTAGVAHDFNNLLTAIRGNAELLELEANAPSELIDPIIQSADNGAALVRQLLAFARKQRLDPVPVCPTDAIDKAVILLRSGLREDIRVEFDTEDGHWAIRIDPELFSSALLNLGTNARDAMPMGGTISISLENLTAVDDNGVQIERVRVSFCDTGIGMSEEARQRAIEPFFTTKEFGLGSGLGLSMVYGFVKQSGGDMTIESRLGGGTCVHLDLPRSHELPPSPSPGGQVSPGARNQRVLLIEDNPSVKNTLEAMITSLGYMVRSVGSVEEARRFLQGGTYQPEIVVSDIVLPGGEWGSKFAAELSESDPDLKILLISGFQSDLDGSGFDNGQLELLAKPFSREQLAARLREFSKR